MRIFAGCAGLLLAVTCSLGSPSAAGAGRPADEGTALTQALAANVKTEWEAFKHKDRRAYGDLLAEDFIAVEDDGQGTRTKTAAANEVDRSVVSDYSLFALTVIPIESNAALVTYEITLQFPRQAQVRLKRVLVSEVWLRRKGQWKMRYYQETHVR